MKFNFYIQSPLLVKVIISLSVLSTSQILVHFLYGKGFYQTSQHLVLFILIIALYIIGTTLLINIIKEHQQTAYSFSKTASFIIYALILVNFLIILFHYRNSPFAVNLITKFNLTRPWQKLQSEATKPEQPATYVYWVRVKGGSDNDCCIGENPTPPTPDTSHIFSLKSEPDIRGYEGVVCSPDCNTKVAWSGPIRFSELEPPSDLVRDLMLTPNGQVDPIPQDAKLGTTILLEIVVKTIGCQNSSCIITSKFVPTKYNSTFGSSYTLNNEEDRILPSTNYDVYVCKFSCQSNEPLVGWNPRRCTSFGQGWIILLIDRPGFDGCGKNVPSL